MKKKVAMLLTGVMAVSLLMTGCQSTKGLENDNIKISVYKGVEVDKVDKPSEVTDDDVNTQIQSVLDENATTKEVTDRAVKKGDTATIDFVGKMNGEAFDGGSSTDYPLEIGSNSFIEGFEDSIIGHKIGDTFDWNGKFPENYGSSDLAGKDVTFTITVKSISKKNTPKLTDKLVKKVSKKSKTVKEYKEEVKKSLEEDNEKTYNDSLQQAAWQKVLDNTKVKKYPEKDVKKIEDSLISQYKSVAEAYNMSYDDLIEQQMGTTVEKFEKQVTKAAKSSVKQTLVTKAIADKENIKLDDETYKTELKKIADAYGYDSVKVLKKAASKSELKEIALNDLVKEWLANQCIQVEASSSSSSNSSSSSSSSDSSSSSSSDSGN